MFRIFQSETYSLIDAVFYNSGVGRTGDASFYNPANLSVDVQNDGTLVTQSTSSNALYYANLGTTSDLYDFEAPFCIEMDIVSADISSNGTVAISTTEKNATGKNTSFASLGITSNNHLKVTVDGTNIIYQVDNNTPITEAYATTMVRVAFLLKSSSVKFKNFMIYSF